MSEIVCPLKTNAEKNGKAIALINSDREITYSEFNELVTKAIPWFVDHDIKKNDRVAILSENRIEIPILLMALIRIGAVAVPINFRLPDISIAEILNQISCSHLISSRNMKLSNITIINLKSFFNEIDKLEPKEYASTLSLEQEATIIFTSGSTGHPKGVIHTLGNHYYSALGSNKNIPLHQGDRWAVLLPFFHVGGLGILFRTMLAGTTAVIPDPGENLEEVIIRYDISHCSMVPTQLYRMLNLKALKEISKSLKALLIGGGRVPHNLIERAFKAGLPIYTSYGLTEMASQVTTTPSDADVELLKTSGQVLNYRELKISDDNEILVRGETLSLCYVKRNKKYKLLDNDGWFHTGDMGSLDKNGYLTVSGRKDNIFISGGENINPETIEAAILELNNIDDVVVVGIDDQEFGQRPVAFLKLSIKIESQEIEKSLRGSLPGYMIPIAFYELPEDNKQGGIKNNRYKLKELAEQLYSSKIQSS